MLRMNESKIFSKFLASICMKRVPDNKAHGAKMGPIWVRQSTDGPHVGPMNFTIWGFFDHPHITGNSYLLLLIPLLTWKYLLTLTIWICKPNPDEWEDIIHPCLNQLRRWSLENKKFHSKVYDGSNYVSILWTYVSKTWPALDYPPEN